MDIPRSGSISGSSEFPRRGGLIPLDAIGEAKGVQASEGLLQTIEPHQ